jgi:hypothetical protein
MLIILIFIIIITYVNTQDNTITLNQFYTNFKKAKYDDNNYYINYFKSSNNTDMLKIFADEKSRTEFYYKTNTPEGYIVAFPNPKYFFFKIMVNPCRNFTQFCCENLAMCEEDNTEIIAGGDLEIAWTCNNFIPICENEFDNNSCGTFIEIHMPSNNKILNEYKINKYYVNGFTTVFMSTKMLCSGRYELWLVSRMKGGNYLYYVKPIYVKYPSCTCDYLISIGYQCATTIKNNSTGS